MYHARPTCQYCESSSLGTCGTVSPPIETRLREVMEAVADYVSLEDAHKPVEMLVYPDEHHVKWQPAHKYAVYRRNLQWFQFWLQAKEVADPVDPGNTPRGRSFGTWPRHPGD